MPNLPFDPIIAALAIVCVIILLLYLREYNKRKKLESSGEKFLQSIQEKSWETLNQAGKKSQEIISLAEMEGVKIAADSKFTLARLEEEYSKKVNEMLSFTQQNINLAQKQFLEFMENLQKRSSDFEEASKKAGEARIAQLFDKVETTLSDFLVQTESKSTSAIELELKATRSFIENYKNQQLKIIDENILAMMEQTLHTVLGKKLSLKDQLDLIYEALEKAKVEKFIV